jgi:hypothetical protein
MRKRPEGASRAQGELRAIRTEAELQVRSPEASRHSKRRWPQAYADRQDAEVLEIICRELGQTSASILLSRKLLLVLRPRPRSHPPTFMAVPHMAWQDNRSGAAACPAARIGTVLGAEELFQLDSINRQRTVACDAINTFGRKSASSPFLPVHRADLEGSRPCENSRAFSRRPVSFAFVRP